MCCDCVYMWMLCFGCLRETVYDLFVCIFLNIYCTFSVPDWIVCWSEFRVLCVCDKPRQSQIIEKQKKLKIPRAVLCVLYSHMNVQKKLVCIIYFSRLFLQKGNTPRALALEKKKSETVNAIDAVHSQHCMRHAHHVAYVTHAVTL